MRALAELGLPALAFTLGVGLATGNWPASLATGLAISSAIFVLSWLDQRFVHPRLRKVSPDWLRLGLEIAGSLFDHFNTLNAIAELIHADSGRAEATVERLAEMFRYVLNGSERGLVSLEEELAFLDDYLEMERVRYGDRLRITREIAPAALGLLVPGLLLQPLVENTVRHGQGADGSIDLDITIRIDGDRAMIAISDRGSGFPARYKIGERPGHGLHNVDQRLRKTYGAAYGLEIGANRPRGTIVTVRIPVGARE